MSEESVAARAAMKKKTRRLSEQVEEKVDASDWSPSEDMETGKKTGKRPVSPNAFKRGGKVEGDKTKARADKKVRKAAGGPLAPGMAGGQPGNNFIDPRVAATQALAPAAARSGVGPNRMDFIGTRPGLLDRASGMGMLKNGGRAKHKDGGRSRLSGKMENPGMVRRESIEDRKSKPGIDHEPRKDGGRTNGKGKTNINIIIAPGGDKQPPIPPLALPPGAPPMPMPPPGLGAGGPSMPPPSMMGRKEGGRIPSNQLEEHGAKSGEGRLDKIEIQKKIR